MYDAFSIGSFLQPILSDQEKSCAVDDSKDLHPKLHYRGSATGLNEKKQPGEMKKDGKERTQKFKRKLFMMP